MLTASIAGPDPLAGTGYPSEHGNFLCTPFFGKETAGDTYLLPCRAPREDWDSPFLNEEFVITAWWPPVMNVIHQYAAAGTHTHPHVSPTYAHPICMHTQLFSRHGRTQASTW